MAVEIEEGTVGWRIRDLREKAGLSQADLARLLGQDTGDLISKYERSVNKPSLEIIERMAPHLRTTPTYIAFGESPPDIEEFSKNQASSPTAAPEVDSAAEGRLLAEIIEIGYAARAKANNKKPMSPERAGAILAYFFIEAKRTGEIHKAGIELLMSAD